MTNIVTAAVAGTRAPTPLIYLTRTNLGVIEHTDYGGGMPLMTLHGGMGGVDQSLLLAHALVGTAAHHRLIALSRPGYLGTPLSSGPTASAQADLIAALLDSLGIEKTIVAAVSAGGPSEIEFAARHPDRCAGLILVSTPSGRFDVPEMALRRLGQFQTLVRIPGVASLLGWLNGRAPEKGAAQSIRDPELRMRTLAHPEAGPMLLSLQRSVFTRLKDRLPGTIADTRAFIDMEPLPLSSVRSPTLVIHGESDAVVPFAHGQRSAAEISDAEFFAVPGGEHVSLFTHLDEVRQRVQSFLSRNDL